MVSAYDIRSKSARTQLTILGKVVPSVFIYSALGASKDCFEVK